MKRTPSRSMGSLTSPGVREYEADQDLNEIDLELEASPSYVKQSA